MTTVRRTTDKTEIPSFNTRSLQNKIELRCCVMVENVGIIAVTEKFIDTIDNDLLSGYNSLNFFLIMIVSTEEVVLVHNMWQHCLIW